VSSDVGSHQGTGQGTGQAAGQGAAWTAAWTAALDELELTLEETERLLAPEQSPGQPGQPPGSAPAIPEPWSPPQLAAPLPAELLGRAQSLLARQHELMDRTVSAMTGARQNIALLGKVADVTGVRRSAQSVYLDVRA
jgi:hypothetical protein